MVAPVAVARAAAHSAPMPFAPPVTRHTSPGPSGISASRRGDTSIGRVTGAARTPVGSYAASTKPVQARCASAAAQPIPAGLSGTSTTSTGTAGFSAARLRPTAAPTPWWCTTTSGTRSASLSRSAAAMSSTGSSTRPGGRASSRAGGAPDPGRKASRTWTAYGCPARFPTSRQSRGTGGVSGADRGTRWWPNTRTHAATPGAGGPPAASAVGSSAMAVANSATDAVARDSGATGRARPSAVATSAASWATRSELRCRSARSRASGVIADSSRSTAAATCAVTADSGSDRGVPGSAATASGALTGTCRRAPAGSGTGVAPDSQGLVRNRRGTAGSNGRVARRLRYASTLSQAPAADSAAGAGAGPSAGAGTATGAAGAAGAPAGDDDLPYRVVGGHHRARPGDEVGGPGEVGGEAGHPGRFGARRGHHRTPSGRQRVRLVLGERAGPDQRGQLAEAVPDGRLGAYPEQVEPAQAGQARPDDRRLGHRGVGGPVGGHRQRVGVPGGPGSQHPRGGARPRPDPRRPPRGQQPHPPRR